MKAYVKDGVVIAIHTTDRIVPTDCTVVELGGRSDIPTLGWTYDGKVFTEPKPKKLDPTLEELKVAASTVVSLAASDVRRHYVGSLQDQLSIYTAKFQDAKAFRMKVFGEKLEDYPWVRSEASATGATAEAVASMFIEKYTALVATLSAVEEVRSTARTLIASAKTLVELREVKSLLLSDLAGMKK